MPRTANKQKKSSQAGQLRIIGGRLRGRKLAIAEVTGLRPSTDRLRETLFNWLQFELAETRVLDLFAGTGALGFEALSRGAAEVHLWERDRVAARQLQQHAQQLASACPGRAIVSIGDSLQGLKQTPAASFDGVFIDPPFGQGLAQPALDALVAGAWLAADAWVYLETEPDLGVTVPAHWQLHREKRMGDVHARLFKLSA
ncbi:16S rRNA (guanine(966)-N(2))-methyltransferase RsmD [Pseudidiomarina taiwanensis]|uniref:Ribosomal RNA small subunit methyltransferase D n=1 Tax=Pseudidiomarina taiwanensis TaxID=337250 RepID=A0A432ZL37_9GAMM|nr:16S rRNA (guanine(966)-N(2))-methyltransferase RsmD [Pseudidiomarina taiwanensis]RUO78688.1 16S rRNA (guanine(966)-N(2))-methyltransferase RsmD [Pseudidiomarina taiwanensis]